MKTLAQNGGRKTQNIDLGLAVLSRITPAGARLTVDEIGAVCGCSGQYIWMIERAALRHAREAMRRRLGMSYGELVNNGVPR